MRTLHTRPPARRARRTVRIVGYLVWNLVLIQGLPLFILGAVSHSRTLEIIGFALLVLFALTGWPGPLFSRALWPERLYRAASDEPHGAADEKSLDDESS